MIFVIFLGETKKNFEIEILYNRRRNWALSFTIILGPDEVINAEIGNKSKAIVTIPRVQATQSLILPAVPIVNILLIVFKLLHPPIINHFSFLLLCGY